MDLGSEILDPLFWGTPIRFDLTFAPIGSVLKVESNKEIVIDAARDSFGRYPPAPLSRQPDYSIRLWVDPVHHQKKPWPRPNFRAARHLFHVSCGDSSFAIADLQSLCAVGFISEEIARDTVFFRNTFLECLFYVLATHRSYTPVHSAGVALQDRGVLICGPPGIGKTSLAYACVRAGMQVLSDDTVHVRSSPESQALVVWGRPWHLRLLPNAIELFPELHGRKAHLRSDYESYLEIDTEKEFPGQAVSSCTPAALVFLERDPMSKVYLEPLEPEAALARLKRDIYLSEEKVRHRHYDVLAKLVETRAFLLRYGGHPSNAVETLARLCD
jgi:hypothetical protein